MSLNAALLKEMISDVPDDYKVIAEGCDCVGAAHGIEVDHTTKEVMISRQLRGKHIVPLGEIAEL